MALDLREMLHDSTRTPPPDSTDLMAVLAGGRRRVRRRRVTVAVAASTLTVAAVLAPALLSRLGGSGPAPAGPVQPVGKVVHLSSAVEAQPGRDYTVLTTQSTGDLDRANGITLGPVTHSGLVLAQDGPHGPHNRVRWGMLNPASGVTDWLPDPDATDAEAPQTLIGVDDERLVLSADTFYDGAGLMAIWTYDFISDRGWRRTDVDISTTGLAFDSFKGLRVDAGRVWFAVENKTADGERPGTAHLWSAALGGATTARDEGVDVGSFDVSDGTLVYLEHDNRPDSVMHVRDLATGEDHSFDTRSGRHCNQLGLDRIGENVTLWQYCGQKDGVRDDRAQVVTLTGDPVVTLQDDGLMSAGGSDRFVSVTSYKNGTAGTYTYDLANDRLLRLSHGFSRYGESGGGAGDRLLWATPVLDGRGRKTWVGNLR